MHSNLARALLAKRVIQVGTIVAAQQAVKSLACVENTRIEAPFVVQRARLLGGTRVVFDVIQPPNLAAEISAEQITRIDGMQIDRMAISHNLKLDGEELPPRPRRGRRPKNLTI